MKGVLMKKIVVLLLVLAIVAGQALFAQEEGLKVSGVVKTGFQMSGGTKDDKDATEKDGIYKMRSDDADVDATRADITLTYNQGNVGATSTFRADVNKTANAAKLANAYGWYNLFDGLVQVSAGLLDNGKWGTLDGFNVNSNLDNANLVKIEVKPIEGLSLGINTMYLNTGHDLDTFKNHNALANTVYGAKYTTDAFGVSAEFVGYSTDYVKIWKANRGGAEFKTAQGSFALVNGLVTTSFGTLISAYFKGVENLSLVMDAYFAADKQEIAKKDQENSSFGIAVQGTFTADKLNVGLNASFGTQSDAYDGNGTGVWDIGIKPFASYTITEWLTAGIEIPIGLVDNLTKIGDGAAPGGTKLAEDPIKLYDEWKGGLNIGVKPNLTFNLGNGGKFVTWYKLDANTRGYLDNDAGKLQGLGKPDNAEITHTWQVDFIWSF
jgi:hypothetical protein